MFREITNIQQNLEEEKFRRWFVNEQFDLTVWLEDQADSTSLVGFELSYKHKGNNYSLRFTKESGLKLFLVDTGEQSPLENLTPTLGELPKDTPFTEEKAFLIAIKSLPPEIANFIHQALSR